MDENGKWRRLHNEEFHSLYRLPNIVRVIKSRRLRWAGRLSLEEGYRKRNADGEWRRLHNEQLHSLYHSPNIVRVIKSRRLRLAGNVARMEEGRSAFKSLLVTLIGKIPLGGLGVDRRTILQLILKIWVSIGNVGPIRPR